MSGAFEMTGFKEFSAAVARAESNIAGDVRAVVVKGADNIKKGMRADMQERPHFKRVAQDINFDTIEERDSMSAEIGPVVGRGKGHAGGLAWIGYFGAPNGGGGTVRDPQHVLDEEAPRFESALDALLAKVIS